MTIEEVEPIRHYDSLTDSKQRWGETPVVSALSLDNQTMNKENYNINQGKGSRIKTPKWQGIEGMNPVVVNLSEEDSSDEKNGDLNPEKSMADHILSNS